jgi:hypothetical protein
MGGRFNRSKILHGRSMLRPISAKTFHRASSAFLARIAVTGAEIVPRVQAMETGSKLQAPQGHSCALKSLFHAEPPAHHVAAARFQTD